MQTLKAARPPESPADPDPVSRLIRVLTDEGFKAMHEDEEWSAFGERVYRRGERVSFVEGETVFILIDFPNLNEKVLGQAVDGITHLFRARKRSDKALSVFQPTTVYVCIIARSESPHTASLNRFISTAGGAVIIPVILVPEINQVVYPSIEEKRGTVLPRIEFLQYVLGERTERVHMHQKTIRTFYASVAVVVALVAGMILTVVGSL